MYLNYKTHFQTYFKDIPETATLLVGVDSKVSHKVLVSLED
jgi:hypothetical protein